MNYEIIYNGETGKTYSVMPIADTLSLADWSTLRVAMTEESSPNAGQYAGTVDTTVSEAWALFESASQPSDWSGVLFEFDLTDEVVAADVSVLNKRQVNKVTLASTGTGAATQIVYDDDGTTPLTTQLVTDDGTTQTQGAAS